MRPTASLLLCILACSFHPSATQNSRADGEIVRYDILPSACVDGEFPNLVDSDTLSPLERNEDATRCAQGLGIENKKNIRTSTPLLSTSKPNDIFLYHLSQIKKGVSFELWLKPHVVKETHPLQPILALGQAVGSETAQDDRSSCGRADLQISQIGHYFQIHYRISDGVFHCHNPILVEFPLEANTMVHLVIALHDGQQHVYVNGKANPHNNELHAPFNTSMQHWHNDFNLQLFPPNLVNYVHSDGWMWNGTVYRFAVYDRFLTQSDARQNFASGLPPTRPFAINQTVQLNEDAEIVAGSHEPGWYSQERNPTHDDVPQINLRFGHLDVEVYELLKSNGVEDAVEPPTPSVFMTRIPERGRLYQPNGFQIYLEFNGRASVDGGSSVVYLPRKDAFSFSGAYTTLFYCVAESDDPEAPCDPGEVEVFVEEVNDPPELVQLPLFNTTTGIPDNVVIYLHGMDVDVNDDVVGVVITSFPEHGQLHYTKRNRSYLNPVDPATANTTMDSPAVMGYRYTAPENVVEADGFIVRDFFTYRAFDTFGALSVEGTIEINIFSSLNVENSTITVLEDTDSNLVLHGNDMSGLERDIGFEIVSLPPPNTGNYYDPKHPQEPLQEGSILTARVGHPYDRAARLRYVPALDFFNYPTIENITEPSIIVFRAVVLDELGVIVAASGKAYMEVLVHNVNDAPVLTVPTNTDHSVEVKRTLNWNGTACNSDAIYNATKKGIDHECITVALVDGITLVDPDWHVDRVRVDVRCENCVLALNPEHRDKAEFVSCGFRNQSTWRCNGNPFGSDQELIFLAVPADITDILSNLYFWSHISGDDNITISIYDGEGEECPRPREQSFHRLMGYEEFSIHEDGCFVASETIPVKVRPFELRKEYKVKRHFPEDLVECPKDVWVVCAVCVLLLLLLFRRRTPPPEEDLEEEKSVTTTETNREEEESYWEGNGLFPDETFEPIPESNDQMQDQHQQEAGTDPFPDVGDGDAWGDQKSTVASTAGDSYQDEPAMFMGTSQTVLDPPFHSSADGPSNGHNVQNPETSIVQEEEEEADGNMLQQPAKEPAPNNQEDVQEEEPSLGVSPWVSYFDPQTNRPYYHNTETGVVTWRCPADYETTSPF